LIAAQQQHAKALALAKDAAQEMQAVGAPLLRLQALQLAAQLLLQDPGRLLQQEQHKQRQQQQQGQQALVLPLDESPLLLEALQLLQVGHLLAACCSAFGHLHVEKVQWHSTHSSLLP
jgi:hypothetical protein